MGLQYAVKERVFNFDETKTKKYVAAPVSDGVIDFSKLCKNVSLICGTHRGQVKLVLDGLLDSLEGYMDEGKTVKLGEFGTLRPTFNAKSGIEAKDVDCVPSTLFSSYPINARLNRLVSRIRFTG